MEKYFWHPGLENRRVGSRSWRWFGFAGIVAMAIALFSVQRPTLAVRSAAITPAHPTLGDTISVILPSTPGSPPTLQLDGKTYPTYPIRPNTVRALIPTTPLDRPGLKQIQVLSGDTSQTLSFRLKGRSFPTQSIWLPDGQDGSVSDWEFDQVDAFKRVVTPEQFWKGSFLRPNDGEMTSPYGVRRYYNGVFADDYFHRGVDYGGDLGSAIIAPAAGRIAFVGYEKDGYAVHGNVIGLDHGQGVGSIFMHLQRINVKLGDVVQAGQRIGTLGDTGASTGPHLHWGLYVNGQAVDPVPWRQTGFE